MGTKSISLIVFVVFQINSLIYGQKSDIIELQNVMIDSITLENGRYISKNFGIARKERKWVEESEDYSRNLMENDYDSIIVQSYTNTRNKKFINWIKVVGADHNIRIDTNNFHINDSISTLKKSYPLIYDSYIKYIFKSNSPKSVIYFGLPVRIVSNQSTLEFYKGSIKFGIFKGLIKEILIDFRPEGDFD